jgi:hypothetical protein
MREIREMSEMGKPGKLQLIGTKRMMREMRNWGVQETTK